jgi:hypothetical protein
MSVAIGVVGVLVLAGAGACLAWWSGGPAGRILEPATPLRVLTLGMIALLVIGSVVLAATGQLGGPLLIGAAMVALGVGGWLGQRWWGRMREIPAHLATGPVRWPILLAGAVLGLAALGSIAVRVGLPLLTGDAQASRSAFAGLTFDVFRWLVPPAALVVMAWALSQPTRRRLAAAALALGGVAGIEVLLASRALPFELAASGLLIVWWSGRRLTRSAWVGLGAAAFVLFIGVLFARMSPSRSFSGPLDTLEFVVDRTVGRIVMIQPRTVDIAVVTIPDLEPFWGGSTYFRRVGGLLGAADDHPPLGVWLYSRLFPNAPPAFAAPGVLTEGWVNAGAVLAIGLMLLLGLGSQGFGKVLDRLGPGPADRAAAAIVTVAIVRTYATSLNGFLLTLGVTFGWWLLIRPGGVSLVRRWLVGLLAAHRTPEALAPLA